VNIGAYGIGKITVDANGHSSTEKKQGDSSDSEADFDDIINKEKRLYTKIKTLTDRVENI